MKPALPATFVLLAIVSCGGTHTEAPGSPVTPTPPSSPNGCASSARVNPPLHTDGSVIRDRDDQRVKLVSANWYGAEEQDHVAAGLEIADVDAIAAQIACAGFNSVRLPWSNELYERNPVVDAAVVAANPRFAGRSALEVLDGIIDSLAAHGLMVILDNHVSRADWCCSSTDGNQLWYNSDYPESSWLADWQGIVRRYASRAAVVGVDLRNEPRGTATWDGPAATDWHAAAERGGNAVLTANPTLLVIVEGTDYATDLTRVARSPVVLKVPHRLVYSAHEYSWFGRTTSEAQLERRLTEQWAYVRTPGMPYTAPVWLGEFGTCHTSAACLQDSSPGSQGFWFSALLQWLGNTDLDWSYWALNGTQARGTSRTFGAEETYGILNTTWSGFAGPKPGPSLLDRLQSVMPTR